MLTAVLALALASSPMKVAFLPLENGEGVNEATARALTHSVLGEARKQRGIAVMSPDELSSILSLERQKALMGCTEDSCRADVSQVLGVDRLLMGSISRLGASWLVHLKLVNARSGGIASQSDRRLKDKTIDDVLDALPSMVNELFGGRGSVATVVPEKPAEAPVVQGSKTSEPGGKDDPFVFEKEKGKEKPKFEVFTDGKGHYVVLEPFNTFNQPVFAGDAKKLYAQTVIGGGSSGKESFDFIFWDSRLPSGWMRSFGYKQDEGYALQCGEKKIPFQPVPKAEKAKFLKKAQLMKGWWRRIPHTVARDDDANYYLLDQRRDVREDFVEPRLFIGPKGNMTEVALKDVVAEQGSLLAISTEGRLKVKGNEAEWISVNGATRTLTLVEMTPDAAKLIYTQLVYKGQPLGTLCDPHL